MHRRDLERAWYAARDAALAQRWGVVRFFRFQRPDGSYGDLALADRDACCWADAVDGTVGLRNSYGLSLCLRLLALVDLLARVRWADSLCLLQRDGADLHPSLLRAAASAPLTAGGALRRTRVPQPARPLRLRFRTGRPGGPTPDRSHAMSRRHRPAPADCWRWRTARRHRRRSARRAPTPPPWPPAASTPTRCTIATIATRSTRSAAANSPYSANYTPGVVDRGLPQRYGHENMVRDCVRNTGTETDRTATTRAPPPATP